MPRLFSREHAAQILRLKEDREFSLLSDAFSMLKAKGTIEFDRKRNLWENKTKS